MIGPTSIGMRPAQTHSPKATRLLATFLITSKYNVTGLNNYVNLKLANYVAMRVAVHCVIGGVDNMHLLLDDPVRTKIQHACSSVTWGP